MKSSSGFIFNKNAFSVVLTVGNKEYSIPSKGRVICTSEELPAKLPKGVIFKESK